MSFPELEAPKEPIGQTRPGRVPAADKCQEKMLAGVSRGATLCQREAVASSPQEFP